jgi:hypothetical protein
LAQKLDEKDLLLAHLTEYSSYHAQKETMTWASATFFVAAVVILVAADPFWRCWDARAFVPFVALLVVTGIVAGAFVWLQFRRRQQSAHFVQACKNVGARWVVSSPKDEDLEPTLVDEFAKRGQLFPKVLALEYRKIMGEPEGIWWDEVATYLIMGLWSVAALLKVVLTWDVS